MSPLQLRRARVGDELAVAQVHVRSWQLAYRGLLPDEGLAALQPAVFAARYTFDREAPRTHLALEDQRVLGFATIGPARAADELGCGELMGFYVDPAAWGRGVGRALMGEALAQLAQQQFTAAVLWVLAGNARAQRFYLAAGWRADGGARRELVLGASVEEVRFRRPLS